MSELRLYQIERVKRLDRAMTVLSFLLLLGTAVVLSIVWYLPRRGWFIMAVPIGGFFVLDLFRLHIFLRWRLLRTTQAFAILAAFLPILAGIVLVYFLPSLFWNTWLWVGMVPFFLLYATLRWQFIDRRIQPGEVKERATACSDGISRKNP
jgi:hypothetical protein